MTSHSIQCLHGLKNMDHWHPEGGILEFLAVIQSLQTEMLCNPVNLNNTMIRIAWYIYAKWICICHEDGPTIFIWITSALSTNYFFGLEYQEWLFLKLNQRWVIVLFVFCHFHLWICPGYYAHWQFSGF